VDEWLEFVYTSPFFWLFISDPLNCELIVRGDGLPLRGGLASFLLITLGNFGVLSKCILFNFVINLASIGEKFVEKLKQAFHYNVDKLNSWEWARQVTLRDG
jgi:hypothetical protein